MSTRSTANGPSLSFGGSDWDFMDLDRVTSDESDGFEIIETSNARAAISSSRPQMSSNSRTQEQIRYGVTRNLQRSSYSVEARKRESTVPQVKLEDGERDGKRRRIDKTSAAERRPLAAKSDTVIDLTEDAADELPTFDGPGRALRTPTKTLTKEVTRPAERHDRPAVHHTPSAVIPKGTYSRLKPYQPFTAAYRASTSAQSPTGIRRPTPTIQPPAHHILRPTPIARPLSSSHHSQAMPEARAGDTLNKSSRPLPSSREKSKPQLPSLSVSGSMRLPFQLDDSDDDDGDIAKPPISTRSTQSTQGPPASRAIQRPNAAEKAQQHQESDRLRQEALAKKQGRRQDSVVSETTTVGNASPRVAETGASHSHTKHLQGDPRVREQTLIEPDSKPHITSSIDAVRQKHAAGPTTPSKVPTTVGVNERAQLIKAHDSSSITPASANEQHAYRHGTKDPLTRLVDREKMSFTTTSRAADNARQHAQVLAKQSATRAADEPPKTERDISTLDSEQMRLQARRLENSRKMQADLQANIKATGEKQRREEKERVEVEAKRTEAEQREAAKREAAAKARQAADAKRLVVRQQREELKNEQERKAWHDSERAKRAQQEQNRKAAQARLKELEIDHVTRHSSLSTLLSNAGKPVPSAATQSKRQAGAEPVCAIPKVKAPPKETHAAYDHDEKQPPREFHSTTGPVSLNSLAGQKVMKKSLKGDRQLGEILPEDAWLLDRRSGSGMRFSDLASLYATKFGKPRDSSTLCRRYKQVKEAVESAGVSSDLLGRVEGGDSQARVELNRKVHGIWPLDSKECCRDESPAKKLLDHDDVGNDDDEDNVGSATRPQTAGKKMDRKMFIHLLESQQKRHEEELEDLKNDLSIRETSPVTQDDRIQWEYRVWRQEISKEQVDEGESLDDQEVLWCQMFDSLADANAAAGQEAIRFLDDRNAECDATRGYNLETKPDENQLQCTAFSLEGGGKVQAGVVRYQRRIDEGVLPNKDGWISKTLWCVKETIVAEFADDDDELFGNTKEVHNTVDSNGHIYSNLARANEEAVRRLVNLAFTPGSVNLDRREKEVEEEVQRYLADLEAEDDDDNRFDNTVPFKGGSLRVWVDDRYLVGPRN